MLYIINALQSRGMETKYISIIFSLIWQKVAPPAQCYTATWNSEGLGRLKVKRLFEEKYTLSNIYAVFFAGPVSSGSSRKLVNSESKNIKPLED